MTQKRVAVLFGGVSSEYEVSLVSASSVIRNLPQDRYELVMVGITKKGQWFLYEDDPALIPTGEWIKSQKLTPAILSPDRTVHGLIAFGSGKPEIIRLDAVFPVLHGKNGEDGTMQGLLEIAGIPYVGCGVLSSSVCMDKEFTHSILENAGIPQAKWRCVRRHGYSFLREAPLLEEALGYPMFVKPANAGSSVGISKAKNRQELEKAIQLAFSHDSKAIVEEFIDGIEVESAVLGNEDLTVSVLGEIVPCNEFYDYEAKYQNDATELYVPARLPQETTEEIREVAAKAYRALGCSGLTRIDFFVKRDGSGIILNEPNTIPGFTSISMYPKLMEASGVPYSTLISQLIELGIQRMEG